MRRHLGEPDTDANPLMPPDARDGSPLALASLPRDRLKAVARSVAFMAIALALAAAGFVLASSALKLQVNLDSAPIRLIFTAQVALVALTVIAPAGLIWLFTREPAAVFGWGRPPRLRQFLVGATGGLALMSLLIGLIALFGAIRFSPPSLPASAVIGYGVSYAAIFALVAVSEEGLLRGYALIQLSRAISFWPAAIVTSLLFVAMHLGHNSETVIGLAQVGLFGLLMAFSVWRTGGLWFALGFHAAWDFTETFVYGVPDSGLTSAGSLVVSHFSGPAWLTGGSAGPEGSVLVLPALAALGSFIHFALPAVDRRAASP
jgi:membrane protease YdiL (CAAX protease family)